MTRFRYSDLAWRVFNPWFRPRMKLGVRTTRVAGIPELLPARRPLLLVSNHVSWWDGFILRGVQQAIRPRQPLHIVMLEGELARRPLLRRLGGVGLDPGSTASLLSLLRDFREERRRDPAFSALFFPQGRIWPSHRRPLGFLGGVRLLSQALAPVTVLPLGLHLEGGKGMAPTAFVSVGRPLAVTDGSLSPEVVEARVEEEVGAIHHFLSQHGEDADENWPGSGEVLPRAPKGVMERR